MDWLSASESWFACLIMQRGIALIYFVAFLSALNQFPALLGENGLLPVPDYVRGRRFFRQPTLFIWHYSDGLLKAVVVGGMVLSGVIAAGLLSGAPSGVSMLCWLLLWFLYLSIVNVGQTFYSFGWESMLIEAGWFAAFLGPATMMPSMVPIFIFRTMLFRIEVGAGLIKLRCGGVWLDRTALDYHHETQPMPNPLSRLAHHLPKPMLHGGVVFSHAVQVVVPCGLFLPQPMAGVAGALIIFHQLLLIIFGNYSWLNWLTVVLAFSAFPDSWPGAVLPALKPGGLVARPLYWDALLLGSGSGPSGSVFRRQKTCAQNNRQ
jgi:hypothetical protein